MTKLTQFFVAVNSNGLYATSIEWRASFTQLHYVAGDQSLPPVLLPKDAIKPFNGEWKLVPVVILPSGDYDASQKNTFS